MIPSTSKNINKRTIKSRKLLLSGVRVLPVARAARSLAAAHVPPAVRNGRRDADSGVLGSYKGAQHVRAWTTVSITQLRGLGAEHLSPSSSHITLYQYSNIQSVVVVRGETWEGALRAMPVCCSETDRRGLVIS